jgi:hypothetical protein
MGFFFLIQVFDRKSAKTQKSFLPQGRRGGENTEFSRESAKCLNCDLYDFYDEYSD